VKQKGKLARYLGAVLALVLVVIGSVLGNLPARGDVTAREAASPHLQTATPTPVPKDPVVNVSPTTVLPNETIIITGTGFTTGGGVTIARITVGGVAVPADKVNQGAPVQVDGSGNFGATVIIPINTTTLTTGSHAVSALDSRGRTGQTTLTIPTRVLKVDPETSRRASTVMVTGTGFPISSARPGAEVNPSIQIRYEITGRPPNTVATVFSNATGDFTASFIVPRDAPIPSSNTVAALILGTAISENKPHSIPDRSVKLTPESGPAGTTITVTGTNFPAFTPVRSLTISRIQVLPSPTPSTNADGSFTASVVAPDLEVGTQAVAIEVGDSTAFISFRMTPPPATPVPPKPTTPSTLLAPLGANLVRVWGFNATTQTFQLYDPAAPALSDLTALVQGRGYWMLVDRAQTVTLASGSYTLSAGWNLIGWVG
jgi:hypothetical protein